MLDIVTSTDMLIRQLMFVDILIGFLIVVILSIGVYFMSVLSDGLKQASDNLGVLNGNVSTAVTDGASKFTQADLDAVAAVRDGIKAANNQLATVTGGPTIP